MVIFNSYVSLPEGITLYHVTIFDTYGRAQFLSGTMVDTCRPFFGDSPKETTGVANAVGRHHGSR